MSCTPSAETAYSMLAASPPLEAPNGGTMLPALRSTNNSPGSACVIKLGSTPRIRTTDEQHARRLAVGQPAEKDLLLLKHLRVKLMNPVQQVIHDAPDSERNR